MRRIPATIVTGFLGAGKTSLVRHLMATASGHRLAIIVNEFGELGIDRDVLLGCGDATCAEDDILELANGCLCCTVADDFLLTLSRLIDRPEPPGHIVIETSGLALPKPLVQAFAWPEIRTRMTVDGVVTVIDAAAAAEGRFASDPDAVARRGPSAHGLVPSGTADPAIDHDNPLEEVFTDQLACADLVILNKTDLLAPERLAALRREIEGEHDHDDFESFVVNTGPIADLAEFRARLGAVIREHDVLRVKGFVDVPDRDRRQVVQAVGDRVQQHFDRPWLAGEARATRLVVIGKKGLDRGGIAAGLGGAPAALDD